MNAPAKVAEATELVAVEEATALSVLQDAAQFEAFYAKIKAECDAFTPDLSSATGRKEIASLAYKVARTKTAIDDAGKKLNEEARAQIAKVDEARRKIRDRLDELKAEVRKPLDEWEAAEAARAERVKATLDRLAAAVVVGIDDTPESVAARVAELRGLDLSDEEFREYAAPARAQRENAIASLEAAIDRLKREAEDRAELERLRKEREEREAKDKAEAEARAAEEQRARDEQLAAERRARAEAEAEAAAQEQARQAERRAAAAASLHQQLKAAAIIAADDTVDTLRARHAEIRALAVSAEVHGDQAEALQAQKRTTLETIDKACAGLIGEQRRREEEAAETRRREQDREHKGRVMGAAKAAIMSAAGIDEETARKVVLAIVAGNVPAVSIKF